ncbi:serine hydrolase domain-containing protein [Polaribacter sp. Asnod6-C07]|uniref:serine hydrolase domain-containing protein n=1 Tax=Polaribacter sp. Asnod6-C07 TaxID=3160582 RepID=UPI00386C735C
MNLFLKITLGFVFVGLLLFFGINLSEKKKSKIGDLTFDKNDSIATKVKLADEWLQQLQKDKKFNGAVLLIKNDQILLKNTYGFADASQQTKLSVSSSFRLASLSKQFTATGIMLLKEQGKLNFNDAITKFLPELNYKNVTIRNLLNHTSGIPDIYMDFPKKYKKEIGVYLSVSKMVELLAKENRPLINMPNEVYRYNNTGYVLLAAIIEKISKISFEDFMKKELFDKLKMKDTRVWNLASKDSTFNNKTNSFHYFLGKPFELKPTVLDGVAGDGSVFCSINDFVIWNNFWHYNNLIAKETMNEALKTTNLNNGKESNYGFGWLITKNDAMWHNGSWLGARTLIIRNESLRNCMVILDNSSSKNIDEMAKQLVDVMR